MKAKNCTFFFRKGELEAQLFSTPTSRFPNETDFLSTTGAKGF